jgi:hypothetical protein
MPSENQENGGWSFEKWASTYKPKRKPKRLRIETQGRAPNGFVRWSDLTHSEQQSFEDTFLSSGAIASRKEHLESKSGFPCVDWVRLLRGLWQTKDMLRRAEDKNLAEAVGEEIRTFRDEQIRGIAHKLILAIEWGDWKSIRELAETGQKVCLEGTAKRLEPPESLADAIDALDDSGEMASLVMGCFYDLIGGVDPAILTDGGVYPPFDPNDGPATVLLKHRPRFREYLVPKRLPTKMTLEDEVAKRWHRESKDFGSLFSRTLGKLGLSLMPEGTGAREPRQRLSKNRLNKKAQELRDSLDL